MKTVKYFLLLPAFLIGQALAQDAKPAPPAPAVVTAPVAAPAMNASEQFTMVVSSLNGEIASLRQQLSNAQRELAVTKACVRVGVPLDRCSVNPNDGSISVIADPTQGTAGTAPTPPAK